MPRKTHVLDSIGAIYAYAASMRPRPDAAENVLFPRVPSPARGGLQ